MPIRPVVRWVAVCQVCGDDNDYLMYSREAAAEFVDLDDEWTITADGRDVCGTSNTAHDEARGGEAPSLLRPDPCAMTVTFDAT